MRSISAGAQSQSERRTGSFRFRGARIIDLGPQERASRERVLPFRVGQRSPTGADQEVPIAAFYEMWRALNGIPPAVVTA